MTSHKPVDWTKPLWTKESPPRWVTPIGKSGGMCYTRDVQIEGIEGISMYTEDGRYWSDRADPLDLQNLPAAPAFDWTKPFRTEDGRRAEARDGLNSKGDRRVWVYENNGGYDWWRYHANGKYAGQRRNYDLVNIEPPAAPLPPAIDWSQPVETCEDPPRPVRVLCTDGPGKYPVVGLMGDIGPNSWTLVGIHDLALPDNIFNLRNTRQQHTVWVNAFPGENGTPSGIVYRTRHEADIYATRDRIACIQLTFREGDGLPVPGNPTNRSTHK